MRPCLLVVDLQNDYFPGGPMALHGIEAAAANAARLLAEFRKARFPVIHIQHVATRPGSTFFLPGTEGVRIHDSVAPQPEEPVVIKHFPNSFRETKLAELLQRAQGAPVVCCGAMSHMCIDATVRAAFDGGYRCMVAEDACATRDLAYQGRILNAADVHASFMAALSGLYAQVAPTREILAGLALP